MAPFQAYCPHCKENTWHYEGKCKWDYLHTATKPDLERRLVLAWDFLDHWQRRLSAPDGAERLSEFYGAMFKFLQREGMSQHSDVAKLDIP